MTFFTLRAHFATGDVAAMSIIELGALGEFLGSIGVVASLIYVGYQVKEARKSVCAATAQARTDVGVQLITSRYTSDIGDLLVKSQNDAAALTDVERFKLNSFFSAHVRQQKLLDDYFSHGVARTTAYWVRNYPWAADEWERVQRNVPPEFARFIDDELAHHPTRYDA
jgi:hypothetical protein